MIPARLGIVGGQALLALAERGCPQPPAGREVELEQRLVGRDVEGRAGHQRRRPDCGAGVDRPGDATVVRAQRRDVPQIGRSDQPVARRIEREAAEDRRAQVLSPQRARWILRRARADRRAWRGSGPNEPGLELVNRDQYVRDDADQSVAVAAKRPADAAQLDRLRLHGDLAERRIVNRDHRVAETRHELPVALRKVQPDVMALANMAERRAPPAENLLVIAGLGNGRGGQAQCDQCGQAAMHAIPRLSLDPR